MSRFTCAACGQEISIYEGVLSWFGKDQEVGNFKLTHRDGGGRRCEIRSNNKCQELYKVASLNGYMSFVQYLFSRWEEGCVIKDFDSLKEIMGEISSYVNERLTVLVGE